MSHAADAVRRFRAAHRLTQRQLARKLQCTNAFISAVERGTKKAPEGWMTIDGVPPEIRRAVIRDEIERLRDQLKHYQRLLREYGDE